MDIVVACKEGMTGMPNVRRRARGIHPCRHTSLFHGQANKYTLKKSVRV